MPSSINKRRENEKGRLQPLIKGSEIEKWSFHHLIKAQET
jgi:hypothetical protein